jgi:hypothetical protein
MLAAELIIGCWLIVMKRVFGRSRSWISRFTAEINAAKSLQQVGFYRRGKSRNVREEDTMRLRIWGAGVRIPSGAPQPALQIARNGRR